MNGILFCSPLLLLGEGSGVRRFSGRVGGEASLALLPSPFGEGGGG